MCWKLHGIPSGSRGDWSGSRGSWSGQSRGRGSYPRAHQSSAIDTLDSASVGQASDGLSSMTTHDLEDVLHHLLDRRSSTALSTFSSSFARSGQDKVKIADGTVSSISGEGPCHEEDDWQW